MQTFSPLRTMVLAASGVLLLSNCHSSSERVYGQAEDKAARLLTSGLEELVVSLTFDDTFASHHAFAREVLDDYHGTFYVNSNRLRWGGNYMTEAQVSELERAGHEVGGHTLHHPHLPALTTALEQRVEICDDRANLLRYGFDVATFSYPFGDEDAAVQAIAHSCGYAWARDAGKLKNVDPLRGNIGYCGDPASNSALPASEQIPPLNPMQIRSIASLKTRCTLDDMRNMVLNAAVDTKEISLQKKRWLILTFHDFCDGCSATLNDNTTERTRLVAFVSWLRSLDGQITATTSSGQSITRPIQIKSIRETLTPSPSIVRENLLTNGSLERARPTLDVPLCFQRVQTGSGSVSWAEVTGKDVKGSNGNYLSRGFAQRMQVSLPAGAPAGSFTVGLTSQRDQGENNGGCAPIAAPGQLFELSGFYKANSVGPVFSLWYKNRVTGDWQLLESSPRLPLHTGDFVEEKWQTTLPLPCEASHVAMRVWTDGTTSLTMDDLTLRMVGTQAPSCP